MTVTVATSPNGPHPNGQGPDQPLRQLVLIGAGHAHLQVLASLATRPMAGVRVVLVTPHPDQMQRAMLPGFVAGHYAVQDCAIPLEPLVRHASVRWLARSVKELDVAQQIITMDDGSTLTYDWLSINTGAIQNRELLEQSMPGSRTHGLFVRPLEAFYTLWPRVVDMGAARALRIAVIGAGDTGIELACAVRKRLPNAALTLVCGPKPLGSNYAEPMQQLLHATLKRTGITVLQDTVTAIQADQVHLGSGARLACDVPLLATGVQAPLWLEHSGLTLDPQGFVAVNTYQQSASHSNVFTAGDDAARAGAALEHNLRAATGGLGLKAHTPTHSALHLLACGGRYAIGTWGKHIVKGHWVWWLKNWIDRRFVAKYR